MDLQDQYLDETAYDAVQRRYLASRFRYVLPAFLVSFGCHLTSGLWSGVSSTYICPLVGGQTWAIPIMQYVCAILDCCLAIAAYELCVRKFSKGKRAGTKTPLVWDSTLVVRAITTGRSRLVADNFLPDSIHGLDFSPHWLYCVLPLTV